MSDKITMLENILPKVDALVIGGGMANTFLKAQGYDVLDEDEAQVVSLDASEFARLQPLGQGLDAETIARLTRRLDAMLAVGRAVSSSLEPAALLTEVLRHCLDVFPAAERALLAIPNRESQTLAVRSMVMREGVEAGGLHLSPAISSEVLYKGRSVIRNATG